MGGLDALPYCWSMIPRVEPEGMLFRKPVSTPDQVRGRLFRDHAQKVQQQQGCEGAQGGHNDPAQMFQQIMQQLHARRSVIRKRAEGSGESWSCLVARPPTPIAHGAYGYFCRILLCTFVLLLSGTAFAAPRSVSKDVKITGGWRCNAYGRSGSWYTNTGTPKPTKDAAQR